MNPDPSFWVQILPFKATIQTWTTVHGNLCLALRHPQNRGPSRSLVTSFVKELGKWLVESGAITQEELESAEILEATEGSMEFGT